MTTRTRGIGFGTMPAVNVCAGCAVIGFAQHGCSGTCDCSVEPGCAGFVPAEEDRAPATTWRGPVFSSLERRG